MTVVAAIDWTNVLVALIAGLPAIIAAIFAGLVHNQVRTPSGKSIGQQVEGAHLTAIANNWLLSQKRGPTKVADPDELHTKESTPPRVPDETP